MSAAVGGREAVYRIGAARFRVYYGDLTEDRSDVLVSSDDNYLTMGGGVSMAINRAGGRDLVDHARKLIPLRQGDVAVTTAGRLSARYVFHAVTIDHDKGTYPDAACIDTLSRQAMRLADALGVRTIALPSLGTGLGGFPYEEAADVMTRAIADHLAADTRLDEVSLVLRARPGVGPGDVELFYERAVALAALSSQSDRLAGAVERLRDVGDETGMTQLISKLDELVTALGRERTTLAATPRSRAEQDRLESDSHVAALADRTVELAAELPRGAAGWRVEKQALHTRLEGLGMQLNVHIGSLNKLEIQKAKHGLGAPVALDHQIEDVKGDIAQVQQTIDEVRGELARLGAG